MLIIIINYLKMHNPNIQVSKYNQAFFTELCYNIDSARNRLQYTNFTFIKRKAVLIMPQKGEVKKETKKKPAELPTGQTKVKKEKKKYD